MTRCPLPPGLRCPNCLGSSLNVAPRVVRCESCSASYEFRNDIIDFRPGGVVASAASLAQSEFFDHPADAEWEIRRPHGAPRFHAWLLADKFRRSIEGLQIRGATALCVCAGSGLDAEFLARAGAQVVATDVSPGAIDRASERARRSQIDLIPVVADVENLPFEDASFDIVYVHDGLHHLENPIVGLDEMMRVARRIVCVSEPAVAKLTSMATKIGLAAEHEEAGNRVARLSLDDVRAQLERAGFKVVRAERYAMLYRHQPGLASRLLSLPGVFTAARCGLASANALIGRFGNKLVVVGVRR